MLLLVVLLGLGPVGSAGRAAAAGRALVDGRPELAGPGSALAITVRWNGVDVANAYAAPQAFDVAPGASAGVTFNYSGPEATSVATAELVLLYLGVALSRESIAPVSLGSAQMTWTFGSLADLTQGVYEVDAELLGANGAALFVEPFYVDVQAPFGIGSAIAFFALVLAAVEVYWIASTARIRLRERQRGR